MMHYTTYVINQLPFSGLIQESSVDGGLRYFKEASGQKLSRIPTKLANEVQLMLNLFEQLSSLENFSEVIGFNSIT